MTREDEERMRVRIGAIKLNAIEGANELLVDLGMMMACEFIPEMEKIGMAVDDIPDWLEDYAKWMRANPEVFK